jgi:lipopolysaccharide/colanic/teichoic acid biosynthesis glycosyltransferase
MKTFSSAAELTEPRARPEARASIHGVSELLQRFAKRSFDVVAAFVGLIVLAPVIAAVALAVWVRMGRPVLFRQVRAGRNEQPFRLFKFRTMTNDRSPTGELRPDSERLTRLGRFLRSSSLDELPQLMNVLTGDVSLVGPRPLPIRYLPRYTSRQKLRHRVRPGITGLAQVNGRNQLEWEFRLELDVKYVERMSLWLDLKILAATVREVALRRGAFDSGSVEEFWGTQGKPANSPQSYPVEENELSKVELSKVVPATAARAASPG